MGRFSEDRKIVFFRIPYFRISSSISEDLFQGHNLSRREETFLAQASSKQSKSEVLLVGFESAEADTLTIVHGNEVPVLTFFGLKLELGALALSFVECLEEDRSGIRHFGSGRMMRTFVSKKR